MAEQNRKTAEERERRESAMKVVDSYIDYLLAEKDAGDIASEGRHILGIYQEHGGLPKSSGFSGFCKLADKVDRMRYTKLTSEMISAKEVVGRLAIDLVSALCVDRVYRDKTKAVATDPLNEKSVEITYKTLDCARMLRISESAYRKRVSRGYQELEIILQSCNMVA